MVTNYCIVIQRFCKYLRDTGLQVFNLHRLITSLLPEKWAYAIYMFILSDGQINRDVYKVTCNAIFRYSRVVNYLGFHKMVDIFLFCFVCVCVRLFFSLRECQCMSFDTESLELSWFQICWYLLTYWWHQRLSLWQHSVLSGTIKLTWWYLEFYYGILGFGGSCNASIKPLMGA